MANELTVTQDSLSTSPDRLITLAIENGANAEVIERLARLQAEMLDRQGEIDFNEAMNRCQLKIARVSPDKTGDKGKYASFAAIEKAIKPIYTAEGFSLSWGETDCPIPEYIRLICYVSRGRHTRRYQKDWPIVTKGAKGNDLMTLTHAHGSADSYAKRYLLKDIWNVAVGENDNDGEPMLPEEVTKTILAMLSADSLETLNALFTPANKQAFLSNDPRSGKALREANAKRRAELGVA